MTGIIGQDLGAERLDVKPDRVYNIGERFLFQTLPAPTTMILTGLIVSRPRYDGWRRLLPNRGRRACETRRCGTQRRHEFPHDRGR